MTNLGNGVQIQEQPHKLMQEIDVSQINAHKES